MEQKINDSFFSFAEVIEETKDNNFRVEYDVQPIYDLPVNANQRIQIKNAIHSLEAQQNYIDNKIAELNKESERLTNNADWLDYSIAVVTGVICGIIDSFFVGDFDLDGAIEKAQHSNAFKKVDNFVTNKAIDTKVSNHIQDKILKEKAKGHIMSKKEISAFKKEIYERISSEMKTLASQDAEIGTRRAMGKAISILEDKFKLPMDKAYEGIQRMESATHHLDDYAHHPTLLGLVAAIFGTFFRVAFFNDKDNHFHIVFKKQDIKEWLKIIAPLIFSGILIWLLYMAKKNQEEIANSKLPKPIQRIIFLTASTPAIIKTFEVVKQWLGHLASDIAGSSSGANQGKLGMGIPGVFLSTLKEMAPLLPLGPKSRAAFTAMLDDLYKNKRLDMRTELGMMPNIIKHLGAQTIPVVLGQILVRSFFFIRHLVSEMSEKKSFDLVDWKKVLPFNNRTIARMITIASGTFTVCDLADACIRSAIENGGNVYNPKLYTDIILRINFVGIGQFAIAVGNEIKMGIDKRNVDNEILSYKNDNLLLDTAKIYYKQADAWISAKDAEEAIQKMQETAKCAINYYNVHLTKMIESMERIIETIPNDDPKLNKELSEIIND